ncbi:MAG: hypothetical protein R2880_04980 [Deinococcales bacterium]
MHPDPADRMLVATALILGLGVAIISKDSRITSYKDIEAIWQSNKIIQLSLQKLGR